MFAQHNVRFGSITRGLSEGAPDSFIDEGIPTYYAFTQSVIPEYGNPTKQDFWILERAAYKAYKEYDKMNGTPDILHAHSTFWGGVAARFRSEKTITPYFLTKHFTGWILSEKRKSLPVFRNELSRTIADSQKIFVASIFYRKELLSNYPVDSGKLTVIPDVVNPLFSEKRMNIQRSFPAVITVIEYLIERKNHTLLKTLYSTAK